MSHHITKNSNQAASLIYMFAKVSFLLSIIALLLFIVFILDEGYQKLQTQNQNLVEQVNGLRAQQVEFEDKIMAKLSNQGGENKPNPPKPNSEDRRLGEISSRYTLMVYVDLECPYCKQAHPFEKAFYQQNKSELSLVLRHFPLESIHPTALKKSEIAECSYIQKGSEAFFNSIDTIFSTEKIEILPTKQLADILNLNDSELDKCFISNQGLVAVKEQQKVGLDSRIPGTPTMFLYDSKTDKLELLDNIGSLSDLQNSFIKFKTQK